MTVDQMNVSLMQQIDNARGYRVPKGTSTKRRRALVLLEKAGRIQFVPGFGWVTVTRPPTPPMVQRVYVIHLFAPNDTNGNPRRCFTFYNAEGNMIGVMDEGYKGDSELALRAGFEGTQGYAALTGGTEFVRLGRYRVSVKEYREVLALA